jgi:hypothetical protein
VYAIVTEDEEDEVASGTIAALEAIGIARDVGIQIRCRGDLWEVGMMWKRMRNENEIYASSSSGGKSATHLSTTQQRVSLSRQNQSRSMPRPRVVSSFATIVAILLTILDGTLSFQSTLTRCHRSATASTTAHNDNIIGILQRRPPSSFGEYDSSSSALYIFKTKQEEETTPTVEETTEKYGLEAGLFQSIKSQDGGTSAKSLLAKYGVAYLATSIPLALLSFIVCYTLVDNGVDVTDLLSKVGINNVLGDNGDKVGTFAIAYAAHKAASPIRFPPTVLLTPIVAKLIGKEPNDNVEE